MEKDKRKKKLDGGRVDNAEVIKELFEDVAIENMAVQEGEHFYTVLYRWSILQQRVPYEMRLTTWYTNDLVGVTFATSSSFLFFRGIMFDLNQRQSDRIKDITQKMHRNSSYK